MRNILTIDFETEAIENGTGKAPKPVGFAYKENDEPSHYVSWGHPEGNNTTWEEGKNKLFNLVLNFSFDSVLCHNAKFDIEVMSQHFDGLNPPRSLDDTMFMAFLMDPNSRSLGLKQLAERYLDEPPEERDEVMEWILANVKGSTPKNWGGYICRAPGDLVGRYACGDVDRTYNLYKLWRPELERDRDAIASREDANFSPRRSTLDAYNLECSLVSIVRKMERVGVPLDPSIVKDHDQWQEVFDAGEEVLHKAIGPEVKLGGKTMFNAMRKVGLINESKIQYTEKGNPRFGREFIPDLVDDPEIKKALLQRSRLNKVIGTYLRPWSDSYKKYGRLHPYFNQTRNTERMGTRTGRFSSNIQQIPKEPAEGMPYLRKYIVPEDGEILLVRDFSAQEIRVAAHFAEGSIMEAYNENPDLDVHNFVVDLVHDRVGQSLSRRICKTISFLKLYGGGPPALVAQVGCTIDEAKAFFKAYDAALPEFKTLGRACEKQVRGGVPIRTYGGRLYDVEPPVRVNGRLQEFYYKLSNTLIQGSSADMTKLAMKRYNNECGSEGRLMLQIHDELVVTAKEEHLHEEMEKLRWAMEEQIGWDVPIKSSGEYGYNYAELKEYEGA